MGKMRRYIEPGETKCYDCSKVIIKSTSLDALLSALGPCPACGSERVGYIRPLEWLRCACGGRVALIGFTNACGCGRDYNRDGQHLAPRSQWGEETGEHPADIGRIL
jgi:ribosomal protein S27E